jgi:hypothetical protein
MIKFSLETHTWFESSPQQVNSVKISPENLREPNLSLVKCRQVPNSAHPFSRPIQHLQHKLDGLNGKFHRQSGLPELHTSDK